MYRLFFGCLCGVFLACQVQAQAQEVPVISRVTLWDNPETYQTEQSLRIFSLVDQALTKFPPTVGEPTERKLALYLLDAMLHLTELDGCDPFFRFVDARMEKVVEALKQPVKKGMYVYKIYNDGFIVRTPSVTMAFDVVRGRSKGRPIVADKYIRQMVEECDILFLSHRHGDHVDSLTVSLFLEAGKPVLAPIEVQKENEGITHFGEDKRVDKEVTLDNGEKLQVSVFPGHQDDLRNNVYVVTTPEKKVVAHTGDQSNEEDIRWIANLHKEIPRPDILTVNCWAPFLKELVEGVNPRVVISGHENEMGHSVSHRESFWLSFQDIKAVCRDYVIMGWGECFRYK